MKNATILTQLIICFFTSSLLGQRLQGFISYQNSGGQPAAGVKVSAPGANTQYTNDNGMFELVFNNNKPGDRIRLSVGGTNGDGKDIVVVNNRVLEFLNLPSNQDLQTVEIVVVYPQQRNEALKRYYGLLEGNIKAGSNEKYDKIIQLLEKKSIDEKTVAILTSQLGEVRSERDKALSIIENQVSFIASINRDNSLAIVKNALIKLDENKDIIGAIDVLDNEKINQEYDNFKTKGGISDFELNQILEAYQLRIKLLVSNFLYRDAVETYHEILKIVEENKLDSPKVAVLLCEYSSLLDIKVESKEAYKYAKKGSDLLKKMFHENDFTYHDILMDCMLTITDLEYELGFKDTFDLRRDVSFVWDTMYQSMAYLNFLDSPYKDVETFTSSLDSFQIFLDFYNEAVAFSQGVCITELDNDVDELSEDCIKSANHLFSLVEELIRYSEDEEISCFFAPALQQKAKIYGHKKEELISSMLKESIEKNDYEDPECQLALAEFLIIPLLDQDSKDSNDWIGNSYFSKILEILTISPDSLHERIFRTYYNLADLVINKDESHLALAIYFLNQGVKIMQNNLHGNDPKLVNPYLQIGDLISNWSDNESDLLEAIKWYKYALEIQKNTLHPLNKDIAHNYSYIGDLYYELEGSFLKEAIEYYEKSNAILIQDLSPDSNWISNHYDDIGEIHFQLHNYDLAARSFRQKNLFQKRTNNIDQLKICETEEIVYLQELMNEFINSFKFGDYEWDTTDTLAAIFYTKRLLDLNKEHGTCLKSNEIVDEYFPDYNFLASLRLLGHLYLGRGDFLKAQEVFEDYDFFVRGDSDEDIFLERERLNSFINWLCYNYHVGDRNAGIQLLNEFYFKIPDYTGVLLSDKYFTKLLNVSYVDERNKFIVTKLSDIFSNHGETAFFSTLVNDSILTDFVNTDEFNTFYRHAKWVNNNRNKAIKLFNSENYIEAIYLFESLYKDFKNPNYLNKIGLSYYYLKDYDKSLKSFVEISNLNLEKTQMDYHKNIGRTYMALNKFKKAFVSFEKYEKLFPGSGTSYKNWAMYYSAKKETNLAIKKLQEGINQSGYIDLKWLENHDRYKELNSYAKKLMEYDNNVDLSFELKNYSVAISLLDSLFYYSRDAKYLNRIGLAYFYLGKYEKSLKFYDKAIQLAPELKKKNYYNNIGMVYVRQNEFKKAYSAFQKYEELHPYSSARVLRNWSMYNGALGNKKESLYNLKRAVRNGYDDLGWLKSDPSIDVLREEKEFIQIINRVEARIRNRGRQIFNDF